MTIPAPPIAADADLRDFAFMPLDVQRLRDSDLVANSSAEGFRCAVLLWCASWHQKPAGSLPDDDKALSQFAGFGRVVSEWLKVKDEALRGWVKCSDGRLYHHVVVEKAAEAWTAKLEQRWKSECARIKKHNQRHGINTPLPSLEEFLSLRQTPPVPRDTVDVSPGTNSDVPEDSDGLSPGTGADCPSIVPRDIASKGQGQGQSYLSSGSNEPSERNAPETKKRSKKPPSNNLAALDTFEPTSEQAARLIEKCPRIADRLENLVLQFRTDPWWAKQFADGKYSDPARCFDNFCAKQEAFAADRGVKPKPQQSKRPLVQPPVFGMRPGELLPPLPPDDQAQSVLQ